MDQTLGAGHAGQTYSNSFGSNLSASIYLYSASPTIANTIIADGFGDGLYANDGSAPTVDECSFASNGAAAISTRWDRLGWIGNVTGSGDILLRTGGAVRANWTLTRNGLPYQIAGDTIIRGNASGAANSVLMTVEAGCRLRFSQGSKLVIGESGYYGALRTLGVSDAPVVLTSANGLAGGWEGIVISQYATSATELRHTVLSCGGSDPSYPANIYVQSTAPRIVGCSVVKSLTNGIVLSSANAQIRNCVVSENANYGIKGTSSSPTITYTDCWGNEYGNYSGVTAGTGCFSSNPLFVNPNQADYHLQTGSPCIDTGDPAMLDLIGSRIDVGAWSVLGSAITPGSIASAKGAADGTPVVVWTSPEKVDTLSVSYRKGV